MNETGQTAGMIGSLVAMFGAGLMLLSLILTAGAGGFSNKDVGLLRKRSDRRRFRESVRTREPIPPEEIPALQVAARVRVAQRWWLLFLLGSVVAETGSTVDHTGPVQITLAACFIAFMAVAAILTGRRARLGAVFLQRYPLPADGGR